MISFCHILHNYSKSLNGRGLILILCDIVFLYSTYITTHMLKVRMTDSLVRMTDSQG